MKSLIQHIKEKLIINKNYKSIININDLSDELNNNKNFNLHKDFLNSILELISIELKNDSTSELVINNKQELSKHIIDDMYELMTSCWKCKEKDINIDELTSNSLFKEIINNDYSTIIYRDKEQKKYSEEHFDLLGDTLYNGPVISDVITIDPVGDANKTLALDIFMINCMNTVYILNIGFIEHYSKKIYIMIK